MKKYGGFGMRLFSYCKLNLYGFILAAALLAFAFYLQITAGLAPCPLCVLQRISMSLLAVLFFAGAIHQPFLSFSRKLYAIVILIVALSGALLAWRQIYLQHLPPGHIKACIPGLGYIFHTLPFLSAVKLMLQGSNDCAQVVWQFWGLSIPEWTLGFFLLFSLIACIQFFRRR